MADYFAAQVASRRNRRPHEQAILTEHLTAIRVLQLAGSMSFATVDYLSRLLTETPGYSEFAVLDFHRVPTVSLAAVKLLAETLDALAARGLTIVLCGVDKSTGFLRGLSTLLGDTRANVRNFRKLDEAVEWAEDQMVYRYGGFTRLNERVPLAEQALLQDMSTEAVAAVRAQCIERQFPTSSRIIATGEASKALYFLLSGMVSVKLLGDIRLATLSAGTVFGEMALLGEPRSAEVWTDTAATCLELSLERFEVLRCEHPEIGARMLRNLASLLAERLTQANTKIEVLSAI